MRETAVARVCGLREVGSVPLANLLEQVSGIDDNYIYWNNVYDWSRYQGDEWSARWGGPDVQWFWSIFPRIRRHLPAATILEIGPGFGRWSRYLREHCQKLILLDLSEKCLAGCRARLAVHAAEHQSDANRTTMHVRTQTTEHSAAPPEETPLAGHSGASLGGPSVGNETLSHFQASEIITILGDGRSLKGVNDESVDFCFSFESLVLAESDVLSDYLRELCRVLKPEGKAFLHHSNLGAYAEYFKAKDLVPKKLRRSLKRAGLLDYDEMRAPSVTAAWFAKETKLAGLSCLSQELIPWGGKRLIDCFSTLEKGPRKKPNQVFENPQFIKRAFEIQRLSRLYGEGVPW